MKLVWKYIYEKFAQWKKFVLETYRKFFFPSKYQNLLLNPYARWQILIIMDTLHCTRRNESMYEVWQYILDNNTVKKHQ